ncbi:MAG: HEAT repeat domain-containing protein [Anaerolineae bacterium]|nr:HEAT repeat domain-containing protein [Anaerolineae bacterium]
MSDLDTFLAKVQQNIKLLSSSDAKIRREAAVWLGEAGDPSAITRLKQVYEEDPNGGVRKAAAYSLGMFRALEIGMNSSDNDLVIERLEDIVLRDKMGRRVPIRLGCLTRLLLALIVSLAIILAFNFLIWPRYQDQILAFLSVPAEQGEMESNPATNTESAQDALDTLLIAIREDAAALQTQYQNPGTLDCQIAFKNPIVYNPDRLGDQPALGAVATRLNAQVMQLVTAKAPYNQACAAGETVLAAEAVAVPLATLETSLADLNAIEADLKAES